MAPPNRIRGGNPAPPDIGDVLLLSLKGIGIAGVFAAIGYVAAAAHQDFLGVRIEANTVAQLSFAAAAFWFDSVLVVLQQAQIHWASAVATLLLLALLSWPHLLPARTSKSFHLASEFTIALLLIVASAGTLLLYQLPTIKLRDAMIVGFCVQPRVTGDGFLNARSNRLWSLMIESRGLGGVCRAATNSDGSGKENAERSLKDGYVLCFLTVVVGWCLIYLRREGHPPQWARPLRMIGILGLVVNTVMTPFAYGKLIAPTTMPYVQVRLQDKLEPARTAHKEQQTRPAAVARWLESDNLLLTEDDKGVTVLHFENQVSWVMEIPRTEITRIDIIDMRDALELKSKNHKEYVLPPA